MPWYIYGAETHHKYIPPTSVTFVTMSDVSVAIYFGASFIGVIMILSLVVIIQAQRKKNQIKLRLSEEKVLQQKELTMNTIKAHEQERQRLGMELHDDLGQNLTFIKMSLQRIDKKNQSGELGDTISVVEESIAKCSQLSKLLYPVVLKKFGLKNGLLQLIHDLNSNSSINILTDFDEINLKKDQELHFYRIAQELLNNTIKYANANRVELSLKQANQNIHFHYKDNGQGFDIEKARTGLGLQNLHTRAHALDAKLSVESSEGSGMSASLIAPVKIDQYMDIL